MYKNSDYSNGFYREDETADKDKRNRVAYQLLRKRKKKNIYKKAA